MGFPRQEYLSVLQFPSPRHLPDPGIKPVSSALAGGFCTTEPPEKLPVCFTRAKPKVNLITQINKAELASNVIGPTFCREMTWLKLQYPNRVFLPLLPEEWKQFP